MNLEVKLIASNLTNRNEPFVGQKIPLDFFANQQNEIEVESLIINGVDFGDRLDGYKQIDGFLAQLSAMGESLSVHLEVLKLILDHKICDTENVIKFATENLIESTVDSSSLGFKNLREIIGDRYADEEVESICKLLPKKKAESVNLYFDRESYIDDLFLNNFKFLRSADNKVQAVLQLKSLNAN